MRTRGTLLLAVGCAVLLVTGCSVSDSPPAVTVVPTKPASSGSSAAPDSTASAAPTTVPTPTASSDAVTDVLCTDGVAQLSGEASSIRLEQDCARVEVAGADLIVVLV